MSATETAESLVDLGEVNPYRISLIVSGVCVRLLREHQSGPKCSHWEILGRDGTATHFRCLSHHGVQGLIPGRAVVLRGFEVEVDTHLSPLWSYVLEHATPPQSRRSHPRTPKCATCRLNCFQHRLNDAAGEVAEVKKLTSEKSGFRLLSGLVVYTGPHCPPVCPGVFVRIFGASVLDDAVCWVGTPAQSITVTQGKELSAYPHGKMTVDSLACFTPQQKPVTADIVGRLLAVPHKRGPRLRTVYLGGVDKDAAVQRLEVRKVPMALLGEAKTGGLVHLTHARIYLDRAQPLAYFNDGASLTLV